MGVLLWPIYRVTKKAASFEWVPGQEKVVQLVQAVMQANLPLGPQDPAEPAVFEVSVADRDGAFGKPL